MKRHIIPVLLLAVLLLGGCGKVRTTDPDPTAQSEKTITCLDDLVGARIGMPSDLGYLEDEFRERFGDISVKYIDDELLALHEVSSGRLDTFFMDIINFNSINKIGEIDDLTVLDEPLKEFPIGLSICKNSRIPDLKAKVDSCIEKLRADGTLADMEQRWFGSDEARMPDIELPESPAYTIKSATYGKLRPFSFMQDNKLSGFDVELSLRIAKELDCGITFDTAEYASMLTGLAAGKYDIISGDVWIVEDRAESIDYSEQYTVSRLIAAVKAGNTGTADSGTASFSETFKDGFRKNFIAQDRWKLIVSGLGVTLIITAGGFLLANILGAVFCAFTMSKRKLLRVLADIYSRIMQGTPIVVVLMLLYYVVFGKSDISGISVAIIAFGLASGASLAQQFYGAVTGVDKGQTEAALAIGFTRYEAFTGIVFPQAARRALSGYFSELINLMRGTAIVGYIAVNDLTNAGDLIRSNTYDAFFPLLSVALIYFLIAFGMLSLLKRIQKKLAPRRVIKKEAAK